MVWGRIRPGEHEQPLSVSCRRRFVFVVGVKGNRTAQNEERWPIEG